MKALIAIVGIASLLGGCATSQRTQPLAWNAEAISRSHAPAMRLQGREGQTVATVSTDRVRSIVEATRRIETTARVIAQVMILDGKDPNAFAIRGKDGVNRIGFTIGMLELLQDDHDAYAAIIGHELAHLVLDHGAIRMEREQARSGAATVLGFALGAVGVPLGGVVADVATNVVSRTFTRDEEREADRYGIRYAREAGFDPQGAVRAWEKMAARSSVTLPFLSTHPMAAERIETMRQFAREAPALDRSSSTTEAALTAPPSSSRGFVRLRPIGMLKSGGLLPAGELYVDMNTVAPSTTDLTSKRAWMLVNLPSASAQGAKSYKAHTLVNCAGRSLAIVESISSPEMNGDGVPIESTTYAPTFRPVGAGTIMESAVNAVCE